MMSDEDNGTERKENNSPCELTGQPKEGRGEKEKEFEEICKNVTPKKIRELANIFKIAPKELVKCLEDHPDGFIAHAVKNELQKPDPYSQKLTNLATVLKKPEVKGFIKKFQPPWLLRAVVIVSPIVLLFIIFQYSMLRNTIIILQKFFEEEFIAGFIAILLTITILILLIFIWMFYKIVSKVAQTEKSSNRYAIEEIVKIIKLIDDD